jgi:hypothetical protein
MLDLVKDIAKFSNNTYGTRRIKVVLNALKIHCKSLKNIKVNEMS